MNFRLRYVYSDGDVSVLSNFYIKGLENLFHETLLFIHVREEKFNELYVVKIGLNQSTHDEFLSSLQSFRNGLEKSSQLFLNQIYEKKFSEAQTKVCLEIQHNYQKYIQRLDEFIHRTQGSCVF